MKTMLDKYISLATNKPWYLLIFTILITAAFAFKLTQLKVDSTPYFIDSSHPERLEESVVRDQFTSTKEQAFVLLVARDGDIFNQNTMGTVRSLTEKFTDLTLVEEGDMAIFMGLKFEDTQRQLAEKIAIDGFTSSDIADLKELRATNTDTLANKFIDDLILRIKPVHKVRSLTSIENITANDGFLDVGPLVESTSNPGELSRLKNKAMENPLYRNILLSNDAKATNIQIEFNIPDHDSPNLVRSYKAVLAIINNEQTDDEIHLGGTPVVNSQIVQVLEQDNAVFFPVVILVIALVLYLAFRRAQGVVIPLLIAILSVVWAMGWMSLMGIKQNVVITALPVFLITIAVADSIHYLAAYYYKMASVDKTTAIQLTLKKLFLPLFLTSLTTIFGFASLTITDLVFVREFGLVMCAGVFFAFVLTITLLPALLKITGAKADQKLFRSNNSFALLCSNCGLKVNDVLKNNSKTGTLVFLVFCVVVGYLSTNIAFDQHNTSSFDEDTRLRKDDVVLNQYLGGTSPLNISFHAAEQGAFSKAEAIVALEKISNHLIETYDTIGYVTSPVDFLKRIHQVVGDEEGRYALPADLSSEMVSQYYLLYETSSGQEIRNVLDETYTNARIALLGHTDQASVWKKIINESDSYIKATLPPGIEYKFSGVGNIQKANLDEVIASQTRSLVVGVILILAAMIFALRSILMGIIGAIPLVLTLGTLFAFLAVSGIHLDIGTSLISALVFGIGVDYSIHFLTHFRRYYRDEGVLLDDAVVATLKEVSTPIAINSIALALGFLVLGLSSYAPIAYLGFFVSGTMILCGVWVLSIVPMLLRLLMPQSAQRFNVSESMIVLKDESNEAH